jgi:hypothetical protein
MSAPTSVIGTKRTCRTVRAIHFRGQSGLYLLAMSISGFGPISDMTCHHTASPGLRLFNLKYLRFRRELAINLTELAPEAEPF